MSFLNNLFGKKQDTTTSSSNDEGKSAVNSASSQGQYSLVKNENGAIVGLWLTDPQDAGPSRIGVIEVLLARHGAPYLIGAARRIVPNNVDNKGDCFVMLNS
ncbi:MAG: hypothetical protein FWH56_08600 [Betaproteobacteria bacterium]|nr:hypothetical protein [Betaproteobacteria bacterium]